MENVVATIHRDLRNIWHNQSWRRIKVILKQVLTEYLHEVFKHSTLPCHTSRNHYWRQVLFVEQCICFVNFWEVDVLQSDYVLHQELARQCLNSFGVRDAPEGNSLLQTWLLMRQQEESESRRCGTIACCELCQVYWLCIWVQESCSMEWFSVHGSKIWCLCH